jgi:Domain of unknown function (DUF4214)
MWFTTTNGIGYIDSAGKFAFFQPETKAQIRQLTVGPDGDMWFTEFADNVVGKITATGVVTEFTLDSTLIDHEDSMSRLTVGSNGNLWFTLADNGEIGEVTPDGVFTLFRLPPNSRPWNITAGPDGSLWFADNTFDGSIGRITTDGVVNEFKLAPGARPDGITTGPDGKLWFTIFATGPQADHASIGSLDPTIVGSGTSDSVTPTLESASDDVVPPIQLFVSELYKDVLGRFGEPDGTNFWFDQLTVGTMSREAVVQSFVGSLEYDQHAVSGLYSSLLERTGDAPGIGFWAQTVQGGATVEDVKAVFLTSDEYARVHSLSSNADFMSSVYHDVLNRSVDASGLATWGSFLAHGGNRELFALALLESTEAQQNLVTDAFGQYLHRRNVDQASLDYFVGQLKQGATDQWLAIAVAGSQEYVGRFENE